MSAYEYVGEHVAETAEKEQVTVGEKVYDVTVTRRMGLDTYTHHGETFLASEAMFLDYGPKMGVTSCFTVIHNEKRRIDLPYPQSSEERETVLKNINYAANQVLRACGIW